MSSSSKSLSETNRPKRACTLTVKREKGKEALNSPHFIWSKHLTAKQRVFIRRRSIRIISSAFLKYVQCRYRYLIDNWGDTDVISQVPVGWIPRQLLVVVPTDGKRYGFNSMELIRWMKRNPTNPCSRELIYPEIGWRCIEIAERFIKLEHRRLGIQKREKRRMNIWKAELAQLQEMQCVIDRFHRKHYHREKERIREETFETEVKEDRSTLLTIIKEIQSTTVMNRITATIMNERVQSINYQCTVTNMKEKPMQKLIDHMTKLMEIFSYSDDEDDEDDVSSNSTASESDEDEDDEDEEDEELTGSEEVYSDSSLEEEDDDENLEDDIEMILAMEIDVTPT